METRMELDELKAAWQALDRRLQLDHTIRLQELRERGRDRIRGHLRPVFIGQAIQMLFGIAMMLLGVACWTQHLHFAPFLVSGLVIHAYGLAVLVLGTRTLALLHGIDFGQPVLELQTRLAKLRRQYLLSGYAAGLPWWVLWMPLLLAVVGVGDLPVESLPPGAFRIAAWVWTSLAFGVVALVALFGFYRWACRPGREALRRRIDDFMTSPALRQAQAQVEELARFDAE